MIATTSRRVLTSVGLLFVVSAAIFFLGSSLAPGNAATTIIGTSGATAQQTLALERQLGLNRPLYVQYWIWLKGVLHGSFGVSPISGRSATSVIGQELPVSLEVAVLAMLVATIVGVALGVLIAIRANGVADYTIRAAGLTGLSVPVFVSGTLLVLAAAHFVPSLYSAGYVSLSENLPENLKDMILPVVATALPFTCLIMQMTRAAMLEQLSQPFMLAARARGLKPRQLYFEHALKTALPSLLTFQAFQFGVLLGSLFLVEEVFSLPGLGRGLVSDISNRDFVLVEAEALVIAAFFIVANLLADLLELAIDPRKRPN